MTQQGATKRDDSAGWVALTSQGCANLVSSTWTVPRFRVWLGVIGYDTLFNQADRAGLVTTQWC